MGKKKIGMWLYQNGGGDIIQEKLIKQLNNKGIEVIPNINLRDATAENSNITWNDIKLDKLDLFFSYNAGEQTQYQMYLFKALSNILPTINNFKAFELTEDKFQTSLLLRKNNVKTADYKLCHRDDTFHLNEIIKQWDKMVYKPTDGWGGVGLTKIENQETLDMLLPFLNQMDLRYFYVEKFIDYDNTDFRIDIVDGIFVGGYGRKAGGSDWRTNITSGGSVFKRDIPKEVIKLAIKAAKITGLEIAGVDIIYDRKKEEYLVLEVNGIPAFITPEQEKIGIDYNDKKIELIANLIERKVNNKTKKKVKVKKGNK